MSATWHESSGSVPFERGSASLVGRSFGPYRVDAEIARGGQGLVLRAVHAQTGVAVALKLLTVRGGAAEKRFRQEAEVLRRLEHPNLPRLVDVGEFEGTPFLILQLIEGETLEQTVKTRGPYPPEAALGLIRGVGGILDYCHGRGILHRDVKPANVVIERASGQPFLVDFGLVLRDAETFGKLSIDDLSRMSHTGELRGTPAFMAPEQAGSSGEIDARADVYGLAATLFFALTGERPFKGTAVYNVLSKVVNEPAPDVRELDPSLPDPVARICRWGMMKDPGARPPTVRDFLEELELACAPDGGSAPRTGGGGAAGLAIVALAMLAVALGVGVAAFLSGGGGEAPLAVTPEPTPTPSPYTPLEAEQEPEHDPEPVPEREPEPVAPSEDPPLEPEDPFLDATPQWFRDLHPDARPHLPLPAGIDFGARPREYRGPDGSTLVWVPGGSYPRSRKRDGQPPRTWTAKLSGYFLGKHEVTWGQYVRYAQQAGVPVRRPSYEVSEDHPVHNVNWWEADAYCRSWGMSLPTDLQWVHAAGPDGATYPWGDGEPTPQQANLEGQLDGYLQAAPVGSFPLGAAPCGAQDLIGNLNEWTFDWRGPDPLPPAGVEVVLDPRGPPQPADLKNAWKSWRGGGFESKPSKATARGGPSAGTQFAHPTTGFRVALSHPRP